MRRRARSPSRPLAAVCGRCPAGAPAAVEATAPVHALGARRRSSATPTATAAASDLGLTLVARDGAVRAALDPRRPTAEGIQHRVARRRRRRHAAGGLDDDFNGLDSFVAASRSRPRTARRLTARHQAACLNGRGPSGSGPRRAGRRRRTPHECCVNPYSLGSVQGVQAGWATPVLSEWQAACGSSAGAYEVRVDDRAAVRRGVRHASAQATAHHPAAGEAEERGRGPDESGPGAGRPRSPAAAPPERSCAAGSTGRRPDLRSLPAWGISLSSNEHYLRFAATVWNAGDSPLVVDGFRRERRGPDGRLPVLLRRRRQPDRLPAGRHLASGTPRDDPPALALRRTSPATRCCDADQDARRYARGKEAFCLANTDAVDLTVPGADVGPGEHRPATSCGDYTSLCVREVASPPAGATPTRSSAPASPSDGLPNGVTHAVRQPPPGRESTQPLPAHDQARRLSCPSTSTCPVRHPTRRTRPADLYAPAMQIQGKVFVVTGGGNGIGREVALALRRRGGVAAVDLRRTASMRPPCSPPPATASPPTRSTSPTGLPSPVLPAAVLAAHGQVDGLLATWPGSSSSSCRSPTSPSRRSSGSSRSTSGASCHTTKAFLPHLLEPPGGVRRQRLQHGRPGTGPRTDDLRRQQGGVKLLTEGLYAELMGTNVAVTTVFPGGVGTGIADNSGAAIPGRRPDQRPGRQPHLTGRRGPADRRGRREGQLPRRHRHATPGCSTCSPGWSRAAPPSWSPRRWPA